MDLGEAVRPEAIAPPPPQTASCVAGIGFRQAAPADEIVALVHRALTASGLHVRNLRRLATAADRADEPAIRAAAGMLAVPLLAVAPEILASVDDRVVTRSERIAATRGVGSVAEAAALVAAGPGGTLVLPRIASARVTCALALGAQSVTQSA